MSSRWIGWAIAACAVASVAATARSHAAPSSRRAPEAGSGDPGEADTERRGGAEARDRAERRGKAERRGEGERRGSAERRAEGERRGKIERRGEGERRGKAERRAEGERRGKTERRARAKVARADDPLPPEEPARTDDSARPAEPARAEARAPAAEPASRPRKRAKPGKPPEARAASATSPRAQRRTGAARSPAAPRSRAAALDAELAPLAADPLLARADRVDGKELRGYVAFTFDDGPSAETTPAVLDALRRYDVPGAFFVVTQRIAGPRGARNREVLARLLAGGYLVASHSVTHRNLRHASTKAMKREIDQSLRTLATAAGRPIGMFRPPFGALDRRGRAHLARRGLTDVRWSIDPADWQVKDAAELRQRTLSEILRLEGGIVLLHDAKALTAQSLALVLDDLEAANCQRLAERRAPILPVSLHYWLRDGGKPRPIPDEVKKRTDAYRAALPGRCAARAPAEAAPELAAAPAPAAAARAAP